MVQPFDYIRDNWAVLKMAPGPFVGLLVVGLAAGFAGGLAWQARQVEIANGTANDLQTKLSNSVDPMATFAMLKLQFPSPDGHPSEVSSQNVPIWRALQTPHVHQTITGPPSGEYDVPSNWVIVVTFGGPTSYKEVTVSPELPQCSVDTQTERNIIVTCTGGLPAVMLEIATKG